MRHIFHIFIIFLAGCLAACQEENVRPSGTPNSFLPPEDATDATSVLRREFYEATGSYLIFNDTLRHEYQGLDAYGNPYYETELLAMEWNLDGGTVNYTFTYDYITDIGQQEEIADFIINNLYPYAQSIMPIAILAVNNIDQYNTYYYPPEYLDSPLTYSNDRCTAINFSGLQTAEDFNVYAQEICAELLLGIWGGDPTWYYSGGDVEGFFFDVGLRYHEHDKHRHNIEYTSEFSGTEEEYFTTRLYNIGFIIDTDETYLPTPKEDIVSYIQACLTMTDEEFRAKYAGYDYVIAKYEFLKPLIEETGINF